MDGMLEGWACIVTIFGYYCVASSLHLGVFVLHHDAVHRACLPLHLLCSMGWMVRHDQEGKALVRFSVAHGPSMFIATSVSVPNIFWC